VSRAEGRESRGSQDADHDRLLERARAGEAAALQTLLVRHEPVLRTYIRLHSDPLLRARESCSDMVQSTFRECLQDAGTFVFQSEPAFRKWLFQKALSKIIDRRRYWLADRRHPGREDSSPVEQLRASTFTASEVAIRNEDLAALEDCFELLPEEYRRVIVAARLVGQSHAEIAADMGRNEGAVRMLLNRALARLGRLMHGREGPEE
jgi:RNA polymerase sigma factor (sigma-70 family)